MTVFIDANVFIFALIDKGTKGEKALNLLDDIVKSKFSAVTSVLVIDEVMWSLIKNNKGPLVELAVKNIYNLPNLFVKGLAAETGYLALHYVNQFKLKPRDAMHCAFMHLNNINTIATDDPDFDKVKQFKRMHL